MKTVFLVEDNEDDIFFLKMACQRSGIPHAFKFVMDGDTAIDYLAGNGPYANRTDHPVPDLIFLDIKLPGRNGHEILEWLRNQPGLKSVPVVMLTSSLQMTDLSRAYELGATSYLRKIACPAEFGQGVRVILKYWLDLNIPAT
jgi:CheY-like chemotaxis protein